MSDVIISSSYHGRSPDCYHTRECCSVKMMQGKKEITETEAQARGLSECTRCANEHSSNDTADFSYFMAAKRAGKND